MQIAVAPAQRPDDYLESIRRAGAEPVLIDWARQSPAEIAQDFGGILLLGGPDVTPALYGEAPHPTFEASEDRRDEHEMALIRYAIERDVPMLAICRGIQILNVTFGGSLVQDIPSQVPGAIRHAKAPDAEKFAIAHDISVTSSSRLHTILSARLTPAATGTTGNNSSATGTGGTCGVNSRHHQAVKSVGRDLVVSAIAPDGIIEAIERPASTFCVGVQWHPENFWRTGEFAALFDAFVTAARRERASIA
jgi:putative glutamine amidotransferase